MKRRAPQAYSLDGEMWPVLAVVRCDEGDVATFEKLAWEWVNEKVGGDFGRLMLRPPKWQWFRMNPCDGGCGAHAWHIAEVDGPGNGRWMGSYVLLDRKPEEVR